MNPTRLKTCSLALLGGFSLWIVAECIEVSGGGFTHLTMLINGFAFPLIAGGIWAVHATQPSRIGRLSLIGTACFSAAYLIFAAGSISVLSSVLTYAEMSEATWLFLGFLFMICGGPLIGVSIMRGQVYPPWTGAAFIFSPLVTATVFMALLPPILMNIANIAVGMSGIVLAYHLLSGRGKAAEA